MKIKVGSRGSQLALTQTRQVLADIHQRYPDTEFSVQVIATQGDKFQDIPLDKMNDKGIFVKEIEQALLEGRIDMAVHSMKDMPSQVTPGLAFSAIPKREDPRDVLVFREGIESLEQIAPGGRIGTGSKRRILELSCVRPDLEAVPIRGNVGTRIDKIQTKGLDGIVLAAAGLHRLSIQEKIGQYLDPTTWIPAPAQGVLALQIRNDDQALHKFLLHMEDPLAKLQALSERAFMYAVGGSCHTPIGAYAVIEGTDLTLYGLFGSQDLTRFSKKSLTGPLENAQQIGETLGKMLMEEVR